MTVRAPRCGIWLFPDRPATDLVGAAVRAEAAGLDEFWIGDEGPAREPFCTLAAAAVRTSRITLAVGVTNPYVRHPALAVTSMLTVHELSGGRALLAVGAGGQLSLGPFELSADRPRVALERFLRIARAVNDATPTEGYVPAGASIAATAVGSPLPVYVGARRERLNRLASASADGAFVAGIPPGAYTRVLAWVRSERSIPVALYPSVAFDEASVERVRPDMIWGLLDTPEEHRAGLDIDPDELAVAADALQRGDQRPARRFMNDDRVRRVLVTGDPVEIGRRLAALVREHRPDSIGAAIIPVDLRRAVDDAAHAFEVMRAELDRDDQRSSP